MAKDVFQVLNDKMQEHIDATNDFLTSGQATDYAAYRDVCGLVRGLRTAQQEIKDLSRAYRENDDE